jgi:hypothetical protein
MLIGLSVSKCIADIMRKEINPEDVLLIIGRTHVNPEQFDSLIIDYSLSPLDPWYDFDAGSVKELLIDFYMRGKLHQPRQFGAHPRQAMQGEHWMRVMLEPNKLSPAAQQAWNNYVLLASLTMKDR